MGAIRRVSMPLVPRVWAASGDHQAHLIDDHGLAKSTSINMPGFARSGAPRVTALLSKASRHPTIRFALRCQFLSGSKGMPANI